MSNKVIKKIKTSCHFPMLHYDAKVRYNEVRKASGIAYILLELIQKSVMGKEKIVDVLLRFGIPTDMHYIFAKELSSLVANGIVATNINPTYVDKLNYFEQMTLEMFSLTEKGKKMFAEGAIPTGQEKAKQSPLFFSPVTRKFALVCTQSYAPLETSYLGADFLDNVQYDVSGMEEFFKSVQTKIGLKAEEMIVSVECEEPKKLAVRTDENMTITIDSDGVTFEFNTSDEKVFFEKYYSSAMMSMGMLLKDKYKFATEVQTINFDPMGVNNIYIPADIGKQATRPCKLFLNRNKIGVSRTDHVLSFEGASTLLDMLDENAEFALLDNRECKFYLPVNVRFPCSNFGDVFEMQVLIEAIADSKTFEALLQEICTITYEADYSPECGQIMAYISSALGDSEYLNGYAAKKLSEPVSDEERIELLLRLHSSFAKCEGWDAHFKRISNDVFQHYVKTVGIDNIIFKHTVLTPLKNAMSMSDREYISCLGTVLKEKESADLVYQALESAGFDEAEILSVVNVISGYMKSVVERKPIDSPTALAGKFSVLQSNLWKLCDMLGVENSVDYTLRDDYNIDNFFDAFATYEKARKTVEKYAAYAKEEFELLSRYTAVFNPIHEVLSIERTASEHPEKITSKFIDEQISRGRFSIAISNLLIKAQYDLRILLSADNSMQANELIDEAQSTGLITRNQANALHKLRMCRNGLQHPEARQIPYDKETLELWKDTVFSLKGDEQ